MSKRPPIGDGHSKITAPRPRTAIGTRPRTGLSVRPVTAKTATPATQPKASRLPLIAFAAIAVLGLGVSVAALMIHFLTGGQQTDFSEEVLSNDLVPVEVATEETVDDSMAPEDIEDIEDPLPEVSRPAMMDLPGSPILVRRQQSVSRQIVKIEGEAAKVAAAMKLPGEMFRLTDSLSTSDGGLTGGVPGSQLGFAFTQTEGGDDADAGDTPLEPEPETANAAVVTVNSEDDAAAGPNRTVFIKPVDGDTTVSALLAAAGFDGDKTKELEVAVKRRLNIEKLTSEYGIAAVGYRPDADSLAYIPAQLAIYKGSGFVGALAITDLGTYEDGANPWQQEEIFREEDNGAPVAKLRLLDVIYNAAVRNQLSTTVAGEIILLLSRNHDLEQTANGDETFVVVYGSKARDKKSGLGRVLYVRVDRGEGESLECYAFQPKPKSPFECISGEGTGAATGGMITPVRGVIATKFGPGRDPATKKRKMNYGVDWVAPPGTPVVAAYAGKVTFAGDDGKSGNTVKLAHEGGQVTVYSNLKTISTGMVEGRAVRAGQRLGTVGIDGKQTEARLHFELHRNGQPVDPFGEYQARVEKGGAIEALVYRITTIESGNNCKAANPLSTAVGLGQFIKSTWMTTIRRHRPDLVAGRTVEQILSLRLDCAIALEMTTALTRENADYIRARGHAVTPGNLYLAHFLGPGGAAQALGTSPGDSVLNAFGAGVVNANPFLKGKTTGWLIEWAARKMAGKGKAPIISASTPQAKAQSFANNANFKKFKDAVATMLN